MHRYIVTFDDGTETLVAGDYTAEAVKRAAADHDGFVTHARRADRRVSPLARTADRLDRSDDSYTRRLVAYRAALLRSVRRAAEDDLVAAIQDASDAGLPYSAITAAAGGDSLVVERAVADLLD
jgi:hypothetical protein